MILNLFEQKFPLGKIHPIVEGGGDNKFAKENCTSSFNCRPITEGEFFSIHSYGLAIDINQIQNPYISGSKDPILLTPNPEEIII